jgi:regulatory protein
MMLRRPAPSLKARALQWLAQREYSRQELAERLRRVVPSAPSEDIEPVLDELQARGLLSDTRFAESRVHARAARFGQRRIQQELRLRGVEIPAELARTLHATEFQRACEVWSRRFGAAATDAADKARQMRFLAGRGFGGDTIRQVLSWAAQDGPGQSADHDPLP